jgi:micrococcal nuclease
MRNLPRGLTLLAWENISHWGKVIASRKTFLEESVRILAMRRLSILVVRWGVGVLFFVNGVSNLLRFPISAVLAILLGLYMIPLVEHHIFRVIKKKPSKWMKLVIAGFLFAAFNLSLPQTPVEQMSPLATPTPESVATISASPASSASALPSPSVLGTASPSTGFYPVIRVVDGDTFKVGINGVTETVRIVGVNTPETVDPRQPVECFGKEASAKAKEILNGQNVRFEKDTTQQDRDRYNRLLRFVFLENGTDVGLKLIQEGYAQESLYSDKPHVYREQYLAAQQEARQNKRGLWADDACVKTGE